MTNMFSPKIADRAAPSTPNASDPAIQDAERATATQAGNMYSRASTVLTSGMGDATAPTIARKSLLGA
jgi:hypothetical protein